MSTKIQKWIVITIGLLLLVNSDARTHNHANFSINELNSVFVIHCEPTNANEFFFSNLINLVALADQYNIKLTILFTAQWAEMILADTTQFSFVENWYSAGHEIGCHHHPYWTTKSRPASWDGYTNTPLNEIAPQDRQEYLGNMNDYMALLNQLPGEMKTGCLEFNEANDEKDWPQEIVYSTKGHTLDDAVSQPQLVNVNNFQVYQIGHGLLYSTPLELFKALYSNTTSEHVFGVNIHVFNYADGPEAVNNWFAYLFEHDSLGVNRKTVSKFLEGFLTLVENKNKDFAAPSDFKLYQNYPNPFNSCTTISYKLSGVSFVELGIYNALGQKIRILVNEKKSEGSYSTIWDGKNNLGNYVCSGIYHYQLKTNNGFRQMKKLLFLK